MHYCDIFVQTEYSVVDMCSSVGKIHQHTLYLHNTLEKINNFLTKTNYNYVLFLLGLDEGCKTTFIASSAKQQVKVVIIVAPHQLLECLVGT